MSFDCIVLDFDGTFTLVDEEAAPFVVGYQRALAELVGASIDDAWAEGHDAIEADPARFGWEHGGFIVAPAHADPYIRCTAIAQRILDARGLLPDAAERARMLHRLYAENYASAAIAFRPDAKEVVEALLETGRVVRVVTNSLTDAVESKLARLAPQGLDRLRVHGDAKKYVVRDPVPSDPSFENIPRETRIEGLERTLFLRRGAYFEVLRQIAMETSVPLDRTLVVGDIYELDLAMPARLGAGIHLVSRPSTADYERNAVRSHPRGTLSDDLRHVLEVIG